MRLQRPLEVVTTAVSGRVLEVLGRGDTWRTRSEILSATGTKSLDRVRLVLQDLSQVGIVDEERDGRQYRYRLNRRHLAAGPIVELVNLRTTFILQLRALVKSWEAPPLYAALFGSAARNDMHIDSDIDLFAVHADDTDTDVWENQMRKAEETILGWTGNPVNFLFISRSELRQNGRREAVGNVITEGIPLLGSRSWLLRETASNRIGSTR